MLKRLASEGNNTAQKWLIEKAEQGDTNAQYTLGKMYEQGKGVKQDEEKAAEWYVKAYPRLDAYNALSKLALGGSKLACEWVIEQAEKKDDEKVQYTLGKMYEQGKGVKQDKEKAAEWYIKAAKQEHYRALDALRELALKGIKLVVKKIKVEAKKGDPIGQHTLGYMYRQGKGVKKDKEKAIECYIKAANQKHQDSFDVLINLASEGNNTAQKWLREKAQAGDKNIQYTLGKMYEQGIGVKKNLEESSGWYIKAAEQGRWKANNKLTRLALKDSNLAQKYLIEQAEKKDDKKVQYTLGKMYEQGKGIKKDEEKAAEWYIKATGQKHKAAARALIKLGLKGTKLAQEWTTKEAEKENKEAQYTLGEMYEQGVGEVKKDEEKAAGWYIKAADNRQWDAPRALSKLALKGNKLAQEWLIEKAEKGNKKAQYILGEMYEQGEGVEKDAGKAIEWYIKAAEQGRWKAINNLAQLALKGSNFAQKYLIEQADKEDIEIQYTLGQMYEQGIGVKKNLEEAAEWYIKAANQGHYRASDALRTCLES